MNVRLELIDPQTVAVTFAYNRDRVAAIKSLSSRRWNPAKSRWEVHLSHLGDLMAFFCLAEGDIDAGMLNKFRATDWDGPLRVELDALHGRIEKNPKVPVREIDATTSYLVPGHQFSPLYKSKKWDGRKHLFSARSGTFPAGLWPRIQTVLQREGVQTEIAGAGFQPVASGGLKTDANAFAKPATELRPYQNMALRKALAAGRGVIQIPTGGGKTLLAAHLIQRAGVQTWFFVHTLDLLYQSAAVFERELGVEVGVLGDGRADLRPLTVATIQTACRVLEDTPKPRARRRKRNPEDEEENQREEQPLELNEATRHEIIAALESARLAIFDECHHVPADSFYRIAMQMRSAVWRFGLSATPWRDDAQDLLLEAALGPMVSVTKFSDLIGLGFLVPPRIRVRCAPMPRIRSPRRLAYSDIYALAIVENRERNRAIAAQAAEWAASGLSTLILVAHTAHGQAIAELLPEAHFVHGAVDSARRRECLEDLERKLRPIMIATTLADEGLDVPTLDGVILAGGGKSATRTYQRIGRALRPADGKREARILDFIDDMPYLRQHSEARLEMYRQEPSFRIEQD